MHDTNRAAESYYSRLVESGRSRKTGIGCLQLKLVVLGYTFLAVIRQDKIIVNRDVVGVKDRIL